jgi:hypothetical protein
MKTGNGGRRSTGGAAKVPIASVRDSVTWIDWVAACGFEVATLAEFFEVSSDFLENWFACVFSCPLPAWLEEARRWAAARWICQGKSTAISFSDAGFGPNWVLEAITDRCRGCHCFIESSRPEPKNGHIRGGRNGWPEWQPEPACVRAIATLCACRYPPRRGHDLVREKALLADLLHGQLLHGSAQARELIYRLFHARTTSWLGVRLYGSDPQLLSDAVTEALFDYFQRPERFHPARRDFEGFLKEAAWRNALNLLEKERRRIAREFRAGTGVELPLEGACFTNRPDPSEELAGREAIADVAQQLAGFRIVLSESEKKMLDLWLQGERKTEHYAAALGLEALPHCKQKEEIIKAKDRLRRKLQRHPWRLDPEAAEPLGKLL